jgi:hypothetical protein
MPREEIQERIRAKVRNVVPMSTKLRAQLARSSPRRRSCGRRRAEAEAEVLRLDAELRGRQRDESWARVQTRRRLREEAERELDLEAERRRAPDVAPTTRPAAGPDRPGVRSG